MRVEVEVPVITTGRMKSAHVDKRVFGSVPRVFDIPEYSAHEVPPVLAFEHGIDSGASSKVRRYEYFGLGGELYVNRMQAPDGEYARALHYNGSSSHPIHPYFEKVRKSIGMAVSELEKESRHSYPKRMIPEEFGTFTKEISQRGKEFKFATLHEMGIRDHYLVNDVDRQIAEFSKRMERMIIVGGQLFMQEQESVMEIEGCSRFYSRPTLKLRTRPETELLVDIDCFSRTVPNGFVSLADFEYLDEHIHFLTENLTSPIVITNLIFRDVEIYDPRYLRISSEATTLAAAANMMRRNFLDPWELREKDVVQQKIMSLDPSVFELFHRLVRGISNSTEMEASEELESALASIIDRNSTQDISDVFGGSNILRYAANALQRWHDRNVELDIGVQPKFSR